MTRVLLFLLLCCAPAMAVQPAWYPMPPDYLRAFADFQKQIPKRGLIADEKAALIIGRAILEAEFGERDVKQAGELEAHRDRDVWVVETRQVEDPFRLGGGYMVAISPHDGRIIYLTEGK